MKIWHTHYQLVNGDDEPIGPGPSNGNFNAGGNPTGDDIGGDAGGCTISTTGITKTTKINFIQVGPDTTCSKTALRDYPTLPLIWATFSTFARCFERQQMPRSAMF
jgi:hypothetical protein